MERSPEEILKQARSASDGVKQSQSATPGGETCGCREEEEETVKIHVSNYHQVIYTNSPYSEYGFRFSS